MNGWVRVVSIASRTFDINLGLSRRESSSDLASSATKAGTDYANPEPSLLR
jgi:hypothetical protein